MTNLLCTYSVVYCESRYLVSQTDRGKCGCAEKSVLRNLIDDSKEVRGRSIRNSSTNGKFARHIVVSRGMCH